MRKVGVLALAVVLAAAMPVQAQTPEYEGEFFTDFTHTVPKRAEVEISRTLRLAAQTSRVHPMLVVVDSVSSYPSMPQDVKGFARTLLRDWKVGDADTHKGVIALFAIRDRKFYVDHTDEVDRSVTDSISRSFGQGTADALKRGDVPRAMNLAASAIASALPRHSATGTTPSSEPAHTVTKTTREHRVHQPTFSHHGSTGLGGLGCFGFMIVLVVVVLIVKALSGASHGWGGHYHGYGGYGYGGGGGGFLSGMATGGLLGYLFGSGGHGHYHGGSSWGSSDTSYTDTTTTESWSWGGGGGDSSSSFGGGFDSFGGGGTSGDSGSGGSW